MGQAERRKIQYLQDTSLQARAREIEDITGIAIPYDIDWDSFVNDLDALHFFDNISCQRISMALRGVCADDAGRQAVQGLKSIKLKNVKTPADMLMAFNDGVLEIHSAYALRTAGMYDDFAIQEFLTRRL